MMKNVLETLTEARGLITEQSNWKQDGLCELGVAEAAGPYCSLGALGKVSELLCASGGGSGSRDGTAPGLFTVWREANTGKREVMAVYQEAVALLEECLGCKVHEFNDTHDHACVLAAFDAAIEKASLVPQNLSCNTELALV